MLKRWKIILTAASLFVVIFLTGAELFWRSLGYTPRIEDTKAFWATQWTESTWVQKPLIFAGASRTLFGIDLDAVRDRLPGKRPFMLAVNGHYPLALLKFLAEKEDFSGTLIIDIDSRGLNKVNHYMQQEYIDFIREKWTPSLYIHRKILNIWQHALVIAGAEFGFSKSIIRYINGNVRPVNSYADFDLDRNGRLDFKGINSKVLSDSFANGLAQNLKDFPAPPPNEWLDDLFVISKWVRQIEQRGGDVVFITPPVSGRQKELYDRAYPRGAYWDVFVKKYSLKYLVIEDLDFISNIKLQDESHMDQKDKKMYTKLVMDGLINKGYLK